MVGCVLWLVSYLGHQGAAWRQLGLPACRRQPKRSHGSRRLPQEQQDVVACRRCPRDCTCQLLAVIGVTYYEYDGAARGAALVCLHAACMSSHRKDVHILPSRDSLQGMHCSLQHEPAWLRKTACSVTGKGVRSTFSACLTCQLSWGPLSLHEFHEGGVAVIGCMPGVPGHGGGPVEGVPARHAGMLALKCKRHMPSGPF